MPRFTLINTSTLSNTLTICLLAATAAVGALFIPAASSESAADATPNADDATITIADFAFSGLTETATGTTITVVNDDVVPHTLTATDGSFDTGSIAPGAQFDLMVGGDGVAAYFCEIHPSMTGELTITS